VINLQQTVQNVNQTYYLIFKKIILKMTYIHKHVYRNVRRDNMLIKTKYVFPVNIYINITCEIINTLFIKKL
jgi:hypothetical protein